MSQTVISPLRKRGGVGGGVNDLTLPPTAKGTYILLLHLLTSQFIEIGQLGTFSLPDGWYAYVGSAFGSGGLRGRLTHHLNPLRRPHWHIDYLRQAANCEEVWYVESEIVFEHEWTARLQSLSGASVPILRFGASDCRCATHLIHFSSRPTFESFVEDVAVQHPNVVINKFGVK